MHFGARVHAKPITHQRLVSDTRYKQKDTQQILQGLDLYHVIYKIILLPPLKISI